MDQLLASPFFELTALLVLAAAAGLLGLLLRQPMVVSFIGVGIIAGPSVLDLVHSRDNIDLLAELGIAVLLFLVGLKLDLKLISSVGVVALATGLGQVLFTSIIGFLLGLALGLDTVSALYVAVALTFSSTIIIVKLLADKREVDSLHGRIAIGFLIVQDLVVVIAMMLLSAFGVTTEDSAGESPVARIATILAYGAGMLILVGIFIRFIANPLMSRVVSSPELLVTFAISWAALLAATGDYLGFSKELGGLLAGISLASTPYREAIVSRLSSLRNFLLLFFFISLGAQLDLGLLGAQIMPGIVFSVFVLIGNPLIVMIIMGAMGYRKRTGFLAGLTVAQISEFSLIFIAMGVALGHTGTESLGLVTLVGLITIALSVYMITWSHSLYRFFEPYLGIFERKSTHREDSAAAAEIATEPHDAILFGLGRYGQAIAEHLVEANVKFLGIDFNPDEVRNWQRRGFDAMYGDASDQDFIAELPHRGVKWVISAMPEHDRGLTHEDPRMVLIEALKDSGYTGKIAISTHNTADIDALTAKGADVVLSPFTDAAERAVERILTASGSPSAAS